MANLSVYNGNFVTFADNEFSSDGSTRKSFSEINSLDLSVSCHVGIFPSTNNEVTIQISAEDPTDFTVFRDGSVLVVKEKFAGDGMSFVSVNGVNFNHVSGNVSIINNRVFVNGREVDPDNMGSAPAPKRLSQIKIFSPHNVDLTAKLDGLSILASKVIFRKAFVKVSGHSTVGLATKSLKLKISGHGENFAVLKGGDLNVSISGHGSVRVKGDYDSADVSVSGMGSIQTDGVCLGDYDASVSGMGKITHTGTIHGRKCESLSGMGSISI